MKWEVLGLGRGNHKRCPGSFQGASRGGEGGGLSSVEGSIAVVSGFDGGVGVGVVAIDERL